MNKGQNIGQVQPQGGTGIPPVAIVGVVVGGLVIVGMVFYYTKIAEFLGLKDTAEEKNLEKQALLTQGSQFWTPAYYKKYGGVTFSDSQLRYLAQELYDATDGAGTYESDIAGVFRRVQTKGNISKMAEIYSQMFTSDLLSDLTGDMGTDEFATYVSKPISLYMNS